MRELETTKSKIVTELKQLCAHCATDSKVEHRCPVAEITRSIQAIRGIPVIVNDKFRGVVWA